MGRPAGPRLRSGAINETFGLFDLGDVPSPDGRYLSRWQREVLEPAAKADRPLGGASDAGVIQYHAGWYDDTHLFRIEPGLGAESRLVMYDVRTGDKLVQP